MAGALNASRPDGAAGNGSAAGSPGGVWSARNTTPAEIDAALRRLLQERHAQTTAYAPARVLNLIVVVDRPFRAEVVGRLERAGRAHPSRTIVCVFEGDRARLGAWATMACDVPSAPGGIALCRERVEIEMGSRHLGHLASIVGWLTVPDVSTLVWSPNGHHEAVDSVIGIAQSVLLDSGEDRDLGDALDRAWALGGRAQVVDLAWVRGAPWRERIAATFDSPGLRRALPEIDSVTVRHHPRSAASGVLLLGWLSSRLGWECAALTSRLDEGSSEPATGRELRALHGRARSGGREVTLCLEPADLEVPGLGGVTVGTASGIRVSLERGPGGLAVRHRAADGRESSRSSLGASRGEPGILAEGIRQALLRDALYRPALESARALLSAEV